MEERKTTDVTITVRFQIEGFHQWKDAPDSVSFLRDRHRHLFHIEAELPVFHDDRDQEFITLRGEIVGFIFDTWGKVGIPLDTSELYCEFGDLSCEMIARVLSEEFLLIRCSIFEDGENGATVYSSPIET